MTASREGGAAMVPPRRRLHRARCALLSLTLLLSACAGEPGQGQGAGGEAGDADGPAPVSFEPIVFPHGEGTRRGAAPQERRERRRPDDDLAGWQEKLDLARRYAAGGYDEQALQVLDAALVQDPPPAWAARMRALKTSLRVRAVHEDLLRLEARGVRDYVGFGQPMDFVIRLRNVSNDVVTLLPPGEEGAGTSPTAVVLELLRRDRDIHATELRRQWNRTVFLQRPGDEPIRIPPGGVHEVPVRVPAEATGGTIAGLRTVELRGTLRPTQLLQGAQPRTLRLPIRPGRVMALPRNFEPLASDPLGSMRTAVETVAPAHLLIATEFVPPRRRSEAAGILAGALAEGHPALFRASLGGLSLLRERSVGRPLEPLVAPLMHRLRTTPDRAEALMEGLSTLTDVRLAPDTRLWLDWWRREATRRAVVTAEGPSEGP